MGAPHPGFATSEVARGCRDEINTTQVFKFNILKTTKFKNKINTSNLNKQQDGERTKNNARTSKQKHIVFFHRGINILFIY